MNNNNIEIAIGEKIKSFRKKREITQEQLADYLNISFQSVSKWECGDAYPDITMLPKIAIFFGVTTDELLCIDKLKEQEEIEDYIRRKEKCYSTGHSKEAMAIMREVNAKYPGNFKLMYELARAIQIDACAEKNDEERKNLRRETISIGEKIRAECKDDTIRRDILGVMCDSYRHLGEKEKAVKLINENLGSYSISREFMLAQILEGDELIRQQQINLMTFIWFGLRNMQLLAEHFALDEKIEVYENIIKIYAMIFTRGDYSLMELSELHVSLAKFYLDSDNNDKAIEHLKKAAELSIAFDNWTPPTQYTSPLINKMAYISMYKNYKGNQSDCMLNGSLISSGLKDEKYNPIRDTP